MSTFRVPYPKEPARRQALFDRAIQKIAPMGSCRGTPEAGSFVAKTPFGPFAGDYRTIDATGEIEFRITKKPFLVPLVLIESEAKRFAAQS